MYGQVVITLTLIPYIGVYCIMGFSKQSLLMAFFQDKNTKLHDGIFDSESEISETKCTDIEEKDALLKETQEHSAQVHTFN